MDDKKISSDQAAYMALNKNLIEPLFDWKFITESKVGSHHVISLTEDGFLYKK